MAKGRNQSVVTDPIGPPAQLDQLPDLRNGLSLYQSQNWAVTMSTPMDKCPTNLNVADPRERSLLVAATQVPDYQLDANGQCIVKATHYFCYAAEYENEQTGELDTVRVSVLFDAQGKIFKTTGVFAFNALRAAATLYSPAEWRAGIPFVIRSRMTANRRMAHDVRVLIDAEDVTGPPSNPQ